MKKFLNFITTAALVVGVFLGAVIILNAITGNKIFDRLVRQVSAEQDTPTPDDLTYDNVPEGCKYNFWLLTNESIAPYVINALATSYEMEPEALATLIERIYPNILDGYVGYEVHLITGMVVEVRIVCVTINEAGEYTPYLETFIVSNERE